MVGTKRGRATKNERPKRAASGSRRTNGAARRGSPSGWARLQQAAVATLLAFALLIVLPLVLENANPLLAAASRTLQNALGLGAYLLPLLLLGLAALLAYALRKRGFRLQTPQVVGWVAFFAGLLGLLFWLQSIGVIAEGDSASGTAGKAIYSSLVNLFGQAGAALVLLVLLLGGAAAGLGVAARRALAFLRSSWRGSVRLARLAQLESRPARAALMRGAAALGRRLRRLSFLALHWTRSTALGAAKNLNARWRDRRECPALPSDPLPVLQGATSNVTATAAGRASASSEESRPAVGESLAPTAKPSKVNGGWQLPPLTLLAPPSETEGMPLDDEERFRSIERGIEKTLADFGVPVKVVERRPGPTVTQFGVEPMFHEKRARDGTVLRREKVKVREIMARHQDLALALAARSIRIEAPVPGRSVVGIEVPNLTSALVSLRGELEHRNFQRLQAKSALPIVLGRDVSGEVVAADLARMPHLLIAGATGTGKSICISSIITTLLMNNTPDQLRLLMVDPKRVELALFDAIPHLLRPVVVDVDKAVPALFQAVSEMDRRYREFQAFGVRNIDGFNRLVAGDRRRPPLPYIAIIIDELADLMMLASDEVERTVCRLAQLARATGIHLVVATQRPSVDIVTGLIKANFPTRVSFTVMSQVDSRTILDTGGAEKLLGRGDMLFLPSDAPKPVRLQGTYVSDKEIEDVTGFWRAQRATQYVSEFVELPIWSPGGENEPDDLYDRAVALAHEHGSISVSFLQRRLRVGWNRAARLMEMLEENGEMSGASAANGEESESGPPEGAGL